MKNKKTTQKVGGSLKDLTGQYFGRLKVLSRVKSTDNRTRWLVSCSCGNKKITLSQTLLQGTSKSCGCLRKESTKITGKKAIINLEGQRFGRLLVKNRVENIGTHGTWLCQCDCGKEKITTSHHLRITGTQSCGCLAKELASKRRKATNKGLTPLLHLVRAQKVYTEWRNAVFERDNYTCQECGLRSGCGKTVMLNADHIKPISIIFLENNVKSLQEMMSCVDLWLIENGRTLCVGCHKKTDTYGGKMHRKIRLLQNTI